MYLQKWIKWKPKSSIMIKSKNLKDKRWVYFDEMVFYEIMMALVDIKHKQETMYLLEIEYGLTVDGRVYVREFMHFNI